jgi:hypothetical protein
VSESGRFDARELFAALASHQVDVELLEALDAADD